MGGKRLLFLGVITCVFTIKSMENGLAGLAAPSFCVTSISNDSEYDVVLTHDKKELLSLRSGQASDGITIIPLERYFDFEDILMYKVENLRIKPVHQKSFFGLLCFSTIFYEGMPSITSGANLYSVKEVSDNLFQSKTLDEDCFIHKDLLSQEDMYVVTAQLCLKGRKFSESSCEITHYFQPKSLDE